MSVTDQAMSGTPGAGDGAITVDARGHHCPVPSLRLRKALEQAPEGAEVELLADDPMAAIDVPHLVGALGYQLIFSRHDGGQMRFRVLKTPR